MTCPDFSWLHQSWLALHTLSKHHQENICTFYRYPPSTHNALSRQFPNTHRTTTKFELLGPLSIVEARCESLSYSTFLTSSCDIGKQTQLLLRPTEAVFGMQAQMEEGKKFERKKVWIAEKVQLFSSRTFSLKTFFCSYGSRDATTMADNSF